MRGVQVSCHRSSVACPIELSCWECFMCSGPGKIGISVSELSKNAVYEELRRGTVVLP